MKWPVFYSMTMNQTWTQKVKLILVTLIQSTTWLSEDTHVVSCCDLQRKKSPQNPIIAIVYILYSASIRVYSWKSCSKKGNSNNLFIEYVSALNRFP